MKLTTKNLLIFSIAFVLIIVLGVLYNSAINNERERIREQKEHIINLVSDLGVKYLEEDTEFNPLEDGDTKIIAKHDGFDNDDNLLAIIYIGQTKGWNEDFRLAYAIDVSTDKIIAMRVVNSNETPRYLNDLLFSDEFIDQFKQKELADKEFDVNPISGTTPGGTEDEQLSPVTTAAFNKILQLVRQQYAQDTDFKLPEQLILLSKTQDFDDLTFVYTFDAYGDNVEAIVGFDYNIISITNEEYREEAENLIDNNKMSVYITDISEDNDVLTITIKSRGYNRNTLLTSTAVVENGNVSSFTTNLSQESYDHEYNDEWPGGGVERFDPIFDAVKNDTDIPNISGATVTINGIRDARDLLYQYLEGVNA